MGVDFHDPEEEEEEIKEIFIYMLHAFVGVVFSANAPIITRNLFFLKLELKVGPNPLDESEILKINDPWIKKLMIWRLSTCLVAYVKLLHLYVAVQLHLNTIVFQILLIFFHGVY